MRERKMKEKRRERKILEGFGFNSSLKTEFILFAGFNFFFNFVFPYYWSYFPILTITRLVLAFEFKFIN